MEVRPAIYTRVSSAEQVNGKCSLPEQQAACEKYCAAKGWNSPKIFTDPGWSGANTERPAFQQMLDEILHGQIDVVVTYKVDRLSRSLKDGVTIVQDCFLENNVDYVAVMDNLVIDEKRQAKMQLDMMLMFAEMERDTITSRMQMGAIARARSGNWHGGGFSPVGYRYDKETKSLVIDAKEAEQVKTIYRLLIEEGMSVNQIQKYMYASGAEYNVGCQYHDEKCLDYDLHRYNSYQTVKSILTSKLYCGYITYTPGIKKYRAQVKQAKKSGRDWRTIPKPEEICVKGNHTPIITEEEYFKAQNKMYELSWEANNKFPEASARKKNPWQSYYLCGGIIWCKKCGVRFAVAGQYSGKRTVYTRFYVCHTRMSPGNKHSAGKGIEWVKCDNKRWPMAELDTRVITDVIKICSSQARYAAQVKAQLSAGQSDEKTALQKKQMAELTAQKAEASKQYEKVIASFMLIADDRVRASVIEQATRLANAISDTDKAMEALKKKMEPNRVIPMEYAQAHDLAHDLTAILKSGNLMEAQKILRMIVKRIDIDDNDLYYTLAGTPTARREKTGGNNAG